MTAADDYYVHRRSKEIVSEYVGLSCSMMSHSSPRINVVCDSGEPAPEGCRRPHSRRVAPERARSC